MTQRRRSQPLPPRQLHCVHPPCTGAEEEKSYEPDDDSTTQDGFNAVDVVEQLAELTNPSVAAVTADAVELDFLKIPPHYSRHLTSTFHASHSAVPPHTSSSVLSLSSTAYAH